MNYPIRNCLLAAICAALLQTILPGQIDVTATGVGIGKPNPVAALDVGGRTFKVSNFEPEYRLDFGGGNDLNWKTIANVTLGSGLYVGASFELNMSTPNTNFGSSVNGLSFKYWIRMTRSGGVQDDYNDAEISGPVAEYVRVVKTATGVYELQVRQAVDWRRMQVLVRAESIYSLGSGGALQYVDNPGTGSTSGTIYTPITTHRDYLTNPYFSGDTTVTGSLGIGTSGSSQKLALDVSGSTLAGGQIPAGYANTARTFEWGLRTLGDGADDGRSAIQMRTIVGSGGSDSEIGFWTNQYGVSRAERVTIKRNGYVGIGTSIPEYPLEINGAVRGTSFISDTTTYSDFVFRPGYVLPTLDEVEAHIAEQGHLPDIPSEEEAMADGIDLAAMQVKLLQKVEELTLYAIEQNRRLLAQEEEIESLTERLKDANIR